MNLAVGKPKIIAYMALYYGRPFIGAAIQSVIDSVDEFVVLYALNPSHNGGTSPLPCPDTQHDLFPIAQTIAGNKLVWINGTWKYEHQQRNAIHEYAPDADIILIVDSDEVYGEGLADGLVERASRMDYRTYRTPFVHYWRSFHKAIIHDPAYPQRVICPKVAEGDYQYAVMKDDQHPLVINHFGYALPPRYVEFKWSGIHGHQAGLRPNWFNEVYLANRQYDCHPVGSTFWNAEPVNYFDYMPPFMQYHPLYGLDLIE